MAELWPHGIMLPERKQIPTVVFSLGGAQSIEAAIICYTS